MNNIENVPRNVINILDYFPRVMCLNCVTSSNHQNRRKSADKEVYKIIPQTSLIGRYDNIPFSFADMVRIPGVEHIIEGYDKNNRVVYMGEPSLLTQRQVRCFDYSLNLVMILTRLLETTDDGYVFFFEDDVHFSNDPDLWKKAMDVCPYSDIMLFDGHIAKTQRELALLSQENEYWNRYDGMVWNISCFALSRKGMTYLRDIMKLFLANPDYFTWATPDCPLEGRFKALCPQHVPFQEIKRNIVRIPLAKQWFEEPSSIHGEKGDDNSLVYPSDYK